MGPLAKCCFVRHRGYRAWPITVYTSTHHSVPTTAPPPFSTLMATDPVVPTSNVSLHVTCLDATLVTVVVVATAVLSVEGTPGSVRGTVVCDGGATGVMSFLPLWDGLWTVGSVATDAAGNSFAASQQQFTGTVFLRVVAFAASC
jgi:hypothetical protein